MRGHKEPNLKEIKKVVKDDTSLDFNPGNFLAFLLQQATRVCYTSSKRIVPIV